MESEGIAFGHDSQKDSLEALHQNTLNVGKQSPILSLARLWRIWRPGLRMEKTVREGSRPADMDRTLFCSEPLR